MTQPITVFGDKRLPRRRNAYGIKRLNILLKFIDEDLGLLSDGAWENLLDLLHQAVVGVDRQRSNDHTLIKSATRELVREAQRTLARAFKESEHTNAIKLDVAKQTLMIVVGKNDPGFYPIYYSDHFPTQVYNVLAEILRAADLNPSSILRCANDKCRSRFVPLRKPHKGMPAYCSPKCTNRVAAIEYRRRQSEERKEKERERNHVAYKKRVETRQGRPTKVKRRPRKRTPN